MDIQPYENNAKIHDKKQLKLLADIVKDVGWRQNVEVNQQGVIVAGHGRWLVWQEYGEKMGLPEVWVMDDMGNTIMGEHATTPLTPEQEREWRLADNQVNALTGMDMDLVIPELKLVDEDRIHLTGFDKDLIIEPEEQDDVVPEIPEEPTAQLGDIYQLGEHRVMCGDSTKIEDVERLMDGKKADILHTDPPYGIDYEGGSKKREKIDNDAIDIYPFYYDVLVNCLAVCKNGASAYIWHASSETHNAIHAFIDAGWDYKQYIIWNKNNSTFGRQDYHWKHEPAIYGWAKNGSHSWHGDRKQTTVWDVERPSVADSHPTMKPIELCSKAILNSTKSEDVVLDVFLGSGSTLIACEKTSRICYGMELDCRYIDVIIKRYEDYSGDKAVKL